MWGPRAIIDSSALRHNLAAARQRAPGARVVAVIKANAYGHGIVPVARALIGADAFGVARLPEALALREHGLGQRIVLLEGVFSADELDAVAVHGLDIVVHTFEQLALLKAWRGTKRIHVWLKVDTGMNRLGFRVGDFIEAWRQLNGCDSVAAKPRLMTHLACADERAQPQTLLQLQRFKSLADGLDVERSIANSAAVLANPDTHVEWVRPGLMLYGIAPFAGETAATHKLLPAMSLVTNLIAVREVGVGETVGYGATWRASRPSRIGIAAIGYGDGYPRQVLADTPVVVRGRRLPLAGRVSMDMLAIDLTSAPDARVGDEVTLWGRDLPVESVAERAGTIPYELVCGISQRVAVEYR